MAKIFHKFTQFFPHIQIYKPMKTKYKYQVVQMTYQLVQKVTSYRILINMLQKFSANAPVVYAGVQVFFSWLKEFHTIIVRNLPTTLFIESAFYIKSNAT